MLKLFFNKKITGSISIMLTLLLLPIYTFIGVMIEGARYRAANQQLDELTYLGELAILADYVDFLQKDFGIYGFDTRDPKNPDNSDFLKKSWEAYVTSATTCGTIDTKNLNKYFGVDLENCTIDKMYALSDPVVLEYQIKQTGRYALPAEILAELLDVGIEVLLGDLLSGIESKLKSMNKKLGKMEKTAESVEKLTGVISGCQKYLKSTTELKKAISTYQSACDAFTTQKAKVKDWTISEDVYNYTEEDINNDKKYKDKYSELKTLMSKDAYKKAASAYLKLYSELEAIKEKDDYQGKNADIASKKAEMDACKVTIDREDASFLDIKGEKKTSEFIDALEEILASSPYSSVNGIIKQMKKPDDYTDNVKILNDKVENIDEMAKKYAECKEAKEAISKYEELYATINGDDGLDKKYTEYKTNTKQVLDDMTKLIDLRLECQAAAMDESIENLNEKSKNSSEVISKASDDIEEDKKKIKEATEERKKAYAEAVKKKNYAVVGENVMSKFLEEITEETLINWYNNFKGKIDKYPKVENGDYEQFKKSLDGIKNYTADKNIIIKNDGVAGAIGTDKLDKVTQNMSKMDDAYSKEKEDDAQKELDKLAIENASLDLLFANLINSPDLYSLDDDWFVGGADGNSYYFSEAMAAMLLSFLLVEVKLESKDSDFFDTLKMLISAFENLAPADVSLNSHVDIKKTEYRFPSAIYTGTIYYEQERTLAKTYADYYLEGQGDYYIYSTDDFSVVADLFNGRTPGKSLENLINGCAGTFGALDSLVQSICPIKIIKLLRSLKEFVKSVIQFLKGLIDFIIDLIEIIAILVTDPLSLLGYFIDQIYYLDYMRNHLSSRVKCEERLYDYNSNALCGSDCENMATFHGAEAEYILAGENCEIKNQRNAYYAIFLIRFLLNYSLVSKNAIVQGLTAIPFVGPFIPFIVDYFESKVDLMMLLLGYSVPIPKKKMDIVAVAENFNTKEKRDEFKNKVQNSLSRSANPRNNKDSYNPLEWKMKTDSNGRKYREYTGVGTLSEYVKGKTTDAMSFEKSGSKLIGTDKDSLIYLKKDEKTKKRSLQFQPGYEDYIYFLTFLYPAEDKMLRIADIMQMHGMIEGREGDHSYDSGFRMDDCGMYVKADVSATYNSLLPLLVDKNKVVPKLRNIQYNGY